MSQDSYNYSRFRIIAVPTATGEGTSTIENAVFSAIRVDGLRIYTRSRGWLGVLAGVQSRDVIMRTEMMVTKKRGGGGREE